MAQKYHRIWLIGFSAAALLACFTYYFQDLFLDNYVRITSESSDYSYLGYYFFSLLASLNIALGPWLLLPAISYALIFFLKIRKQDSPYDFAYPFLLIVISISFLSMVAPVALGGGLKHLIFNSLKAEGWMSLLGVCGLFLLFGVYFRTAIIQRFNEFKSSKNRLENSYIEKQVHAQTDDTSIVQPVVSEVKSVQLIDSNAEQQELDFIEEKQEPNSEQTSVSIGINKPIAASVVQGVPPVPAVKTKKKEKSVDYFKLVEKKLRTGSSQRNTPEKNYFDAIIERIEDKLEEFKINGTIINILKGPVVDTFELELGNGVKVSKITSITQDMSLALFGAPIRIVYPMKGKSTVGIEVPRNPREMIYLGEILESDAWRQNTFSLPLAMGKDAFGVPFVVDLASMPHMLVAGATGAGKSVFINSLLMSLLVKKSPDQMRLILIDPKQLELALYAKLPHLILPVLTDAKSASAALLYAVQEMERRYSILKEFAVRNVDGFNRKVATATPEQFELIKKHYPSGTSNFILPYLVIIVDEFADLILTKSGKDIEINICRLAAKARASGIHLVLATQRPSVDVITGTIKSNFPTRVSFKVTTSIDSRTILNAMGAESLLGKGDMLYMHGPEVLRVHSSYVDEDEIEAFTNDLCGYQHEFDPEALEFLENQQSPSGSGSASSYGDLDDGNSDEDDLYEQAVYIVAECRMASASMLQRRLKVGYNRAANLVELMERRGVVGPAQGSKPRKVLVSAPESAGL